MCNPIYAAQKAEKAKNLIKNNQHKEALLLLLNIDSKNSDIENLIGEIYHFGGKGVVIDFKKAFFWYEKAFKNGNKEAPNHLGRIYCNGEGVSIDFEKAAYWYKKAYEMGNKVAKHNFNNLKRRTKK